MSDDAASERFDDDEFARQRAELRAKLKRLKTRKQQQLSRSSSSGSYSHSRSQSHSSTPSLAALPNGRQDSDGGGSSDRSSPVLPPTAMASMMANEYANGAPSETQRKNNKNKNKDKNKDKNRKNKKKSGKRQTNKKDNKGSSKKQTKATKQNGDDMDDAVAAVVLDEDDEDEEEEEVLQQHERQVSAIVLDMSDGETSEELVDEDDGDNEARRRSRRMLASVASARLKREQQNAKKKNKKNSNKKKNSSKKQKKQSSDKKKKKKLSLKQKQKTAKTRPKANSVKHKRQRSLTAKKNSIKKKKAGGTHRRSNSLRSPLNVNKNSLSYSGSASGNNSLSHSLSHSGNNSSKNNSLRNNNASSSGGGPPRLLVRSESKSALVIGDEELEAPAELARKLANNEVDFDRIMASQTPHITPRVTPTHTPKQSPRGRGRRLAAKKQKGKRQKGKEQRKQQQGRNGYEYGDDDDDGSVEDIADSSDSSMSAEMDYKHRETDDYESDSDEAEGDGMPRSQSIRRASTSNDAEWLSSSGNKNDSSPRRSLSRPLTSRGRPVSSTKRGKQKRPNSARRQSARTEDEYRRTLSSQSSKRPKMKKGKLASSGSGGGGGGGGGADDGGGISRRRSELDADTRRGQRRRSERRRFRPAPASALKQSTAANASAYELRYNNSSNSRGNDGDFNPPPPSNSAVSSTRAPRSATPSSDPIYIRGGGKQKQRKSSKKLTRSGSKRSLGQQNSTSELELPRIPSISVASGAANWGVQQQDVAANGYDYGGNDALVRSSSGSSNHSTTSGDSDESLEEQEDTDTDSDGSFDGDAVTAAGRQKRASEAAQRRRSKRRDGLDDEDEDDNEFEARVARASRARAARSKKKKRKKNSSKKSSSKKKSSKKKKMRRKRRRRKKKKKKKISDKSEQKPGDGDLKQRKQRDRETSLSDSILTGDDASGDDMQGRAHDEQYSAAAAMNGDSGHHGRRSHSSVSVSVSKNDDTAKSGPVNDFDKGMHLGVFGLMFQVFGVPLVPLEVCPSRAANAAHASACARVSALLRGAHTLVVLVLLVLSMVRQAAMESVAGYPVEHVAWVLATLAPLILFGAVVFPLVAQQQAPQRAVKLLRAQLRVENTRRQGYLEEGGDDADARLATLSPRLGRVLPNQWLPFSFRAHTFAFAVIIFSAWGAWLVRSGAWRSLWDDALSLDMRFSRVDELCVDHLIGSVRVCVALSSLASLTTMAGFGLFVCVTSLVLHVFLQRITMLLREVKTMEEQSQGDSLSNYRMTTLNIWVRQLQNEERSLRVYFVLPSLLATLLFLIHILIYSGILFYSRGEYPEPASVVLPIVALCTFSYLFAVSSKFVRQRRVLEARVRNLESDLSRNWRLLSQALQGRHPDDDMHLYDGDDLYDDEEADYYYDEQGVDADEIADDTGYDYDGNYALYDGVDVAVDDKQDERKQDESTSSVPSLMHKSSSSGIGRVSVVDEAIPQTRQARQGSTSSLREALEEINTDSESESRSQSGYLGFSFGGGGGSKSRKNIKKSSNKAKKKQEDVEMQRRRESDSAKLSASRMQLNQQQQDSSVPVSSSLASLVTQVAQPSSTSYSPYALYAQQEAAKQQPSEHAPAPQPPRSYGRNPSMRRNGSNSFKRRGRSPSLARTAKLPTVFATLWRRTLLLLVVVAALVAARVKLTFPTCVGFTTTPPPSSASAGASSSTSSPIASDDAGTWLIGERTTQFACSDWQIMTRSAVRAVFAFGVAAVSPFIALRLMTGVELRRRLRVPTVVMTVVSIAIGYSVMDQRSSDGAGYYATNAALFVLSAVCCGWLLGRRMRRGGMAVYFGAYVCFLALSLYVQSAWLVSQWTEALSASAGSGRLEVIFALYPAMRLVSSLVLQTIVKRWQAGVDRNPLVRNVSSAIGLPHFAFGIVGHLMIIVVGATDSLTRALTLSLLYGLVSFVTRLVGPLVHYVLWLSYSQSQNLAFDKSEQLRSSRMATHALFVETLSEHLAVVCALPMYLFVQWHYNTLDWSSTAAMNAVAVGVTGVLLVALSSVLMMKLEGSYLERNVFLWYSRSRRRRYLKTFAPLVVIVTLVCSPDWLLVAKAPQIV